MTRFALLLTVVTGFVAACDDQHYLYVSVTSRPAVHDAQTLRVTLSNEGSMRTDDFSLAGRNFPVTFSVSSPDRMGDLVIAAEAMDETGIVVGRGGATSAFLDDSATLLLDSTDFVVNTTVADDQFLSNDFEANGNQLGASDDGTWMVTYREACLDPCHMYGRRFDATGAALDSSAAASTMAFPLSTTLTSSISTPAVAGAGSKMVAVWDYSDTVAAETGVACRSIDATGKTSPTQTSIAVDAADVVSLAAMSNRNFAVVWNSTATPGRINSEVIRDDCSTLGTVTVATEVTGDLFQRPVVAAADGKILYAWILNGSVHARIADNANAFQSADTIVINANAIDQVDYVRAIPFAGGFAIIARWTQVTGTATGRIDLYKITAAGVAVPGQPILITDKAGGEFASAQGFGAATRADGTAYIVWHACGTNGDDSGCGVFGRAVEASGPLGEAVVIPTTTTGDQTDPSVVASGDAFVVGWNDASAQEPDRSKLAVRARVMYIDGADTQ